nr:hypothetical protein [Roseateles sp.]
MSDAAADGAQLAGEQAHEAALLVAWRAGEVIVVQAQGRAFAQGHHGAVDHAQLDAALACLHGLAGFDAAARLELAGFTLGRQRAHIATGEQHRGRRRRPGESGEG